MKITYVKTDDNVIKEYENNPRINDKAIDAVAHSIEKYGFKQPIVLSKDGTIVVGHTRYLASKKLGLQKVPVIYSDLSEEDERAYRIADNRVSQESDWDYKLLKLEFNELIETDFNLLDTGFNQEELDELLYVEKEGLTDDDYVPDVPEEPITKLGDIWLLDNHRLLCGDATKEEDVNKLMDGAKADMVFTDPPYGLNYKYNSYVDVEGNEYLEFCDKWFPLLQTHTDFIFLTAGWKYNNYWIKKNPTDIFYWIAKNKQSGGKLSWYRKVEPIFLFGKPNNKNKYDTDYFEQLNEYRSKDGAEKHTCPKPVKFVTEATKIMGNKKIVLDVFLGSGTTIIACEKNNNICYGIEFDPKYCDVIVKRWEDYTGNKGKLEKVV